MADSDARSAAIRLDRLFEPSNRGLLLDVTTFVLNLVAMAALSRLFLEVIRRADRGEETAHLVLFGAAAAMFVLPPLGATLKRWHYHQRVRGAGQRPADGCLFNPIFYFCLTAVIFAAVNAFLMQRVYGRTEPPAGFFVGSIFLGIALMILHTALVYRYFAPPKAPPKSAFLRSSASGIVGDVCLFANMMLFQLIWNLLSMAELSHPSGVGELVGRLFLVLFLALLIYFPPRMFYLAEDIGRRRTWITILLANAPLLVRVLWGTGPSISF